MMANCYKCTHIEARPRVWGIVGLAFFVADGKELVAYGSATVVCVELVPMKAGRFTCRSSEPIPAISSRLS